MALNGLVVCAETAGCVIQVGAQWLDETLRTLPTQRADGVVTVTEQQMTRIQHVCRSLSLSLSLSLSVFLAVT